MAYFVSPLVWKIVVHLEHEDAKGTEIPESLFIIHHQKIKVMVVVLEVVALLVVLIAPLAPARKAVK